MMAHDSRAWMLSEAVQWLKLADQLQSQFFRLGRSTHVLCWEPPVDIYADDNGLGVLVALPGVASDRYSVTLEPSTLLVQGERLLNLGASSGDILRLEIPYGRFERRIALPPGDYQIANCLLESGCLRLHLERLQ